MSILLDASKTGRENFFDLLALLNPVAAYADGRVTLGQPTVNEATLKTDIELVAISGQGFTDSVVVSYDRRDPVEAAGTHLKGPVKVSPGDTDEAILAKIIAHHGIIAEEVEITGAGPDGSFVIPTWAGDESEDFIFTITSNPTSLVYQDINGPFQGSFESDSYQQPLSSAITQADLGEFEAA